MIDEKPNDKTRARAWVDKNKKVGAGLGVGSALAVLYSLDPIKFTEYLSLAMQQEISRLLIAFAVAAWIHAGRVKKEFANVTEAINGLGAALRSDLSALSERVGDLEKKINVNGPTDQTIKGR